MSTWRVVGQRQVTELDSLGRQVDGIEVHFVTDRGEEGRIRLPLAQADENTVRGLIERQVAIYDSIAALGGGH